MNAGSGPMLTATRRSPVAAVGKMQESEIAMFPPCRFMELRASSAEMDERGTNRKKRIPSGDWTRSSEERIRRAFKRAVISGRKVCISPGAVGERSLARWSAEKLGGEPGIGKFSSGRLS